MADTTHTLAYTAEQINRRLDLINENKNWLPYPYTYTSLPAGLEDVGDGSFLTTTDINSNKEVILVTNCVLPEGSYIVSIEVIDVLDNVYSNDKFSLKINSTAKTTGAKYTASTSPISISLAIPSGTKAELLIKPMIRKADDADATWAPYMGKIGNYVDERFNGTNAKIKVIADTLRKIRTEDWEFVLDDGSSVPKKVLVVDN